MHRNLRIIILTGPVLFLLISANAFSCTGPEPGDYIEGYAGDILRISHITPNWRQKWLSPSEHCKIFKFLGNNWAYWDKNIPSQCYPNTDCAVVLSRLFILVVTDAPDDIAVTWPVDSCEKNPDCAAIRPRNTGPPPCE